VAWMALAVLAHVRGAVRCLAAGVAVLLLCCGAACQHACQAPWWHLHCQAIRRLGVCEMPVACSDQMSCMLLPRGTQRGSWPAGAGQVLAPACERKKERLCTGLSASAMGPRAVAGGECAKGNH
jgi:hypothetical protein